MRHVKHDAWPSVCCTAVCVCVCFGLRVAHGVIMKHDAWPYVCCVYVSACVRAHARTCMRACTSQLTPSTKLLCFAPWHVTHGQPTAITNQLQLSGLTRKGLPWGKALDEMDTLVDPPEADVAQG